MISKLEPSDLALLWLCAIHLEAYMHLPTWVSASDFLMSKVSKSLTSSSFWSLVDESSRRSFNRRFFAALSYAYHNLTLSYEKDNCFNLARQYDLFLMPWTSGPTKLACSLDKIQTMMHQALRTINLRLPANSDSTLALKLEIRMHSLPLFINLINLEVASKVSKFLYFCCSFLD